MTLLLILGIIVLAGGLGYSLGHIVGVAKSNTERYKDVKHE